MRGNYQEEETTKAIVKIMVDLCKATIRPQVTIGKYSMQIDITKVKVDIYKDPFKDYGTNIVENLSSNNS